MKTLSEKMAEGQKKLDDIAAKAAAADGGDRAYKGVGRFVSALGLGALGLYIGKFVGGFAGGAVTGVLTKANLPTSATAAHVGGRLGAGIGAIYGAASGWSASAQAQEEHQQLTSENAVLKQKLSWVEKVAKGETPEQGKDIGRA